MIATALRRTVEPTCSSCSSSPRRSDRPNTQHPSLHQLDPDLRSSLTANCNCCSPSASLVSSKLCSCASFLSAVHLSSLCCASFNEQRGISSLCFASFITLLCIFSSSVLLLCWLRHASLLSLSLASSFLRLTDALQSLAGWLAVDTSRRVDAL